MTNALPEIPADVRRTLLAAVAYYMGDETSRIHAASWADPLEARCLAAIEWVATQTVPAVPAVPPATEAT